MKNTEHNRSAKSSTKMIDEVEMRYGPKDWDEFDKLEREHEQHISTLSNEDDEVNLVTNKKKKQKQTKKEKKMTEISEYEDALRNLRRNSKEFKSPFDKHKVTIHEMMNFMKLLQGAFDSEMNIEIALKSLGLKRLKILFKSGAHTNIGFVLKYLQSDGSLPKWLLSRHRDLMKSQEDEFNNDQNTLLRTMSSTGNKCLTGEGFNE